VQPDPDEFSNRTITVQGLDGRIPNAGTEQRPLELFVGNAGTAARFLSALVCLGNGVYRLSGVARMHERPQAALFTALRELGYRVESINDKLPAIIYGIGPRAGKCTVSIEESSQFASALLLGATVCGWKVKVVGDNAEESPYVAMTSKLIEVFPKNGGEFQIEPDASNGSYFLAAGWLVETVDLRLAVEAALKKLGRELEPGESLSLKALERGEITVSQWPSSHWQFDEDFTIFIRAGKAAHPAEISRKHDLGDSIMTAIVLAPFSGQSVKFTDLGRLRVQETERVVALRTELTKCDAKVVEAGDMLTVYPSQLHGAEIETYNDHRMAMCFAILGLKVPGIKLRNPSCVKKTFPDFFQKLAAAPPSGLGAIIRDAKTGRELHGEELFAE
jgi:3-phosphoshikimate 1-carboxyvinyltransferase